MNCKERLKEYTDKDKIYQDYKQNKLMNPSDFDKFCIQHCKDIEELLEENLELEQALDDIEKICNSISREDSICDIGKIHDIEVIIKKASNNCKKKVQCIETGIIYDSAKDVEIKLNINHSHISDCCKGKRNKTGGYSWRFVNE